MSRSLAYLGGKWPLSVPEDRVISVGLMPGEAAVPTCANLSTGSFRTIPPLSSQGRGYSRSGNVPYSKIIVSFKNAS